MPASPTHVELTRRPSSTRPNGRVLLLGFEDQDNLGLRYLSSQLRAHGHETRILTFKGGSTSIAQACEDFGPHLVGFSLIFQYLAPDYGRLAAELRTAGVTAHFTIGGHYASFEHEGLLRAIPALDSVVRFEGEQTVVALIDRLAGGADWRDLAGITWRDPAGGIVVNESRVGIDDLDLLPWPDRDDIDYEAHEIPTASVLGSRGCPWRCSFCSIITFYEGNGTKGRRRRRPERVVDELEHLCRDRGVRVVLWQDDDFLAGGRRGREWAQDIARESMRRGLHERLRWKLSCRSDECRRESLEPLVEAGLTHVYLGVEAGDADDLVHLNKLEKADDHLRAAAVLQDLGVSFDFGFMLLNPWSTTTSVANNIDFLRQLSGNGAAAVNFCRMLPYVGTPAADRLREEGRLEVDDLDADYRFLDPALDRYHAWVESTFHDRNGPADGTLNLLRLLLFEASLRLPEIPPDPVYRLQAQLLTATANRAVLDTLEAGIDRLPDVDLDSPTDPVLDGLTAAQRQQDAMLRNDIAALLATRPTAAERIHVMR